MTENKKLSETEQDEIKEAVRETYSKVAKKEANHGDEPAPSSTRCCG